MLIGQNHSLTYQQTLRAPVSRRSLTVSLTFHMELRSKRATVLYYDDHQQINQRLWSELLSNSLLHQYQPSLATQRTTRIAETRDFNKVKLVLKYDKIFSWLQQTTLSQIKYFCEQYLSKTQQFSSIFYGKQLDFYGTH